MKRIERKMKRIATRWKAREAMSVNPKNKKIRVLKEICLAETAFKIWLEIGGTKQNERIVDYQHVHNAEAKKKRENTTIIRVG